MCFPCHVFFPQLEDEEADVGGEEGEPSQATYSAQRGRGCRGCGGVENGGCKIVGLVFFVWPSKVVCMFFLEYMPHSQLGWDGMGWVAEKKRLVINIYAWWKRGINENDKNA